ncbi:Protein C05G5.3, partial [Aphelenchoides avenae]
RVPVIEDQDVPVPGGFNPDIINQLWKPDRKKKADDKAPLLGPLNNDDDEEENDDDRKENGTHEHFEEDDFKISRDDIRFVDNDEGIEEDAREGEEKASSPGRDGSTKSKKPKSDEDKELLDKITKDGLHGKLATAQLRSRTSKLEKSMTDQEREEERRIRNEQLEMIFKLMADQENKFGIHDKGELVEQMRLYSV